jgi:hypothetical protein
MQMKFPIIFVFLKKKKKKRRLLAQIIPFEYDKVGISHGMEDHIMQLEYFDIERLLKVPDEKKKKEV